MDYTSESRNFIYTIEQEKEMLRLQKGIDEAKAYDDMLREYIRGIIKKTMSPGLSIRRIIDEKYVSKEGVFSYEGEIIEGMPYFDMCYTKDELEKYKNAFKILAKKKNISCENKQYKLWLQALHSYSISRKMLYKIAFILGLNEIETENWFVNKLMIQGFNYRDVEEVVYAFCLKRSVTYQETLELIEISKDIVSEHKTIGKAEKHTTFLSEQTLKLREKEELFEYLKDNADEFSRISISRLDEFKGLCEEAKNLIMDVSKGQVYVFDSSRPESARFESSNRMLGNMLTFGIPVVDDAEYSVKNREDLLSKDVTQNELGAQRIEGIIKGKINIERKDILWLQFFIRAMEIQYFKELGIECFENEVGIENAENFKSYMDDYLPTLGFGGIYYANAFDNIVYFSLLDERPYETFLSLLENTEI